MNDLKTSAVRLLRWTERYTKTDMVYLVKGGLNLTIAQGFNSLVIFCMALAYARFVDKESYGTYQFILSLMGIAGAVSLTGLGSAVTRAIAQQKKYSSVFLFWKAILWNSGTAVVALAMAAYYVFQENTVIGSSLLLVSIVGPFFNTFQTYEAPFVGRKLFGTVATLQILRGSIVALALLAAVLLSGNPLVMFATYLLGHTVVTGAFYLYGHRTFATKNNVDDETSEAATNEIITTSKNFSVMNVIGKISGELDRILLFHFLGPVQVATYTFALAAPRQIQHINKTLKSLLLSKLSTRDPETLKRTLPRKALLMYIYIIPIIILYIPLAPFLYGFLFPAYVDAAVYSQVYIFVLLFAPLLVLNEALIAHNKQKDLYVISTAVPITRLVLLLALTPFFGIWGVVTASLGSLCVQSILVVTSFRRL